MERDGRFATLLRDHFQKGRFAELVLRGHHSEILGEAERTIRLKTKF